nr:MAK10-like protein [Tanacetum cinerariifolium]
MVIKDLDLEPKVDAMMRDFLKLKRYRIVPYEELNGILVALVARLPAFFCIAVDTSRETRGHRKDTIGLRSEDPNQHLKDFLKLVDLLDLDVTRRTIDQSAGGKLHDRNAKESWALLEDLALYANESWNVPMDFAKLVKAITLPQDVPSTSDRRLIELENQV